MKHRSLSLIALMALCLSATAQITAPTVQPRSETDTRYMAGAVLEHGGYAYLTRTIETDKSAEELMPVLDAWLQRCMNDSRIEYQRRLAPKADNLLQHSVMIQLTFSQSFLSHDWADMSYVLTLEALPGKVVMNLERISYKYREGDDVVKYMAEEIITDSQAITKKGKLVLGYKKFRIKTIDLMDEFETSLRSELQK